MSPRQQPPLNPPRECAKAPLPPPTEKKKPVLAHATPRIPPPSTNHHHPAAQYTRTTYRGLPYPPNGPKTATPPDLSQPQSTDRIHPQKNQNHPREWIHRMLLPLHPPALAAPPASGSHALVGTPLRGSANELTHPFLAREPGPPAPLRLPCARPTPRGGRRLLAPVPPRPHALTALPAAPHHRAKHHRQSFLSADHHGGLLALAPPLCRSRVPLDKRP
ncbi:unnamed protein product [Pleuronectes platessa]|uniref:Uncharacterized protein n=1 Tax=Pleuronectes platessa TaxID=8262 RepID=A0A9N7VWG7_PLEPL|nr:unnamed protein product [Pleuronectes platessa]